jgi:hypothetical protein
MIAANSVARGEARFMTVGAGPRRNGARGEAKAVAQRGVPKEPN